MSRTEPTHRHGRSRRGRQVAIASLLAAGLLLAACGSEEELGGTVVEDGVGCTLSEVERSTEEAPTIEAGIEVGDEAEFEDLVEGEEDACEASATKYLTMDLVGATATDGTVFNSTFGEERPITARLGQGQIISGLELGLDGMKVGSRRQITVPAELAYGTDGDESLGIGPDADLVFVVDLVALTDTPLFCNEAAPIPEGVVDGKPTEVALPVEPPTDEVVTTVLTEGDGPEATASSYLTVDYLGVSCANGQQFDSSWDNGEPITVALSEAEPTATAFSVIPGWTEGMVGQKQGSTIQIDIPFDQAYGTAGRPPSIGPSDPLTFIVEILEVSDEAPPDPTAESTTTVAGGEGGDGEATTTTAAAGG